MTVPTATSFQSAMTAAPTRWNSQRRLDRKASPELTGAFDAERNVGAWWWPVLCLTLAVTVLAARLAGSGSPARKFFPAADSAAGPPELDSFSEPGVACAILKEETQRLWWAFQIGGAKEEQVSQTQHGAAAADASNQSLMSLETQVQDLALDLNQHVMEMELNNQAWDAFLDRYLSVAYAAPCRTEVSSWAQLALESAQKCGRTQALETALRRVIRVRHSLGRAAEVEAVLDAWNTQQSSGNDVSER